MKTGSLKSENRKMIIN